jgi:hypothetical protein
MSSGGHPTPGKATLKCKKAPEEPNVRDGGDAHLSVPTVSDGRVGVGRVDRALEDEIVLVDACAHADQLTLSSVALAVA